MKTGNAINDDENKKRMIISDPQTLKNVTYGPAPAQTLDIYLPPNRSVLSTKTLVIIHGGGFNSGNKDELTAYIQPMQQRLGDYAFCNISYRQAATADTLFPIQENDVKAALRFITDHSLEYGVSKKMVLLGVSAGGLLALLQGYKYTDPIVPNAIISFFAPTDLVKLYKHSLNPLVALTLRQVTGATPDENPRIYIESSPVNFVTATSPPTLLFQGGLDPIVNIDQQIILQDKLTKAGIRNQFVFYANEGHGWCGETLADSFDKIETFLNENG
ncbi:MAG TPA: alpha/beta hydrolase [Chitinophagaceae bacterium]|nr:alpha/beta hydrolase [Chitinophagaceae bacterium]